MPSMKQKGEERVAALQKKLALVDEQISLEKGAQDILLPEDNPTFQNYKRIHDAIESKIQSAKDYMAKTISEQTQKVEELEKSLAVYKGRLAALSSDDRQPTSIYYRKLVSKAEKLRLEIDATRKLYKLETCLEKKVDRATPSPGGSGWPPQVQNPEQLSRNEIQTSFMENNPAKPPVQTSGGKRDWARNPPRTEQEVEQWEVEQRAAAEQRWRKEEELWNRGFQS